VNTVAIDWDDTLVGSSKHPKGRWLPGAPAALLGLRRARYELVIHSCRAGWPEGRDEIAAMLATIGFRGGELRIEPKPEALCYGDDRAIPFTGDWTTALKQIRALEAKR